MNRGENSPLFGPIILLQGGVVGLSYAVILCCEVHSEGILHYFSPPPSNLSPAGPPLPVVPEAEALLLEGDVLIEGPSHIQAVVVLLAWLRSLRDKARSA